MISDTSLLNPNGTGIGLTVTKKYIEALGGDIQLKSDFGEGTSVLFNLPLILEIESNDLIDALDIPNENSPSTYSNLEMLES